MLASSFMPEFFRIPLRFYIRNMVSSFEEQRGRFAPLRTIGDCSFSREKILEEEKKALQYSNTCCCSDRYTTTILTAETAIGYPFDNAHPAEFRSCIGCFFYSSLNPQLRGSEGFPIRKPIRIVLLKTTRMKDCRSIVIA